MTSTIMKLKSRYTRTPWIKRAGVAGLAFFLAKGLLWLGIAAAAAWQVFAD